MVARLSTFVWLKKSVQGREIGWKTRQSKLKTAEKKSQKIAFSTDPRATSCNASPYFLVIVVPRLQCFRELCEFLTEFWISFGIWSARTAACDMFITLECCDTLVEFDLLSQELLTEGTSPCELLFLLVYKTLELGSQVCSGWLSDERVMAICVDGKTRTHHAVVRGHD